MADSSADLFPRILGAGTSFEHLIASAAWPAPDWTLTAVLRGPVPMNLVASHEGSRHRFCVPAAMTSTWTAGRYVLSLRASRGDEVREIDTGEVTIRPDISQLAAGHDARSHVERALAAIEAVIEKRATIDQERYRINNRELWRTPVGELLRLRDRYKAELARMQAVRRGDLFGRTVKVAFR